jgi:hypothetical protein
MNDETAAQAVKDLVDELASLKRQNEHLKSLLADTDQRIKARDDLNKSLHKDLKMLATKAPKKQLIRIVDVTNDYITHQHRLLDNLARTLENACEEVTK